MKIKEKYQLNPDEVRIYKLEDSCIFKKNNDKYGGLSNMSTNYPLNINNITIKTTEALYQACRFPYNPEIQERIINQKSPMQVKMISNANKKKSREDWDSVRIKIMKWCINLKLAQNFITFGTTLNETGQKFIVESSSSDNFWGAIPNEENKEFIGKNALGRLLMDLRQNYYGIDRYSLLYLEPPKIKDFFLLNEPINTVDERKNFVYTLENYWSKQYIKSNQNNLFSNM